MRHFKFIMLVIIATAIASCNKSKDEGTGTGDAIIVAKQSGTNTVYGLSLYAYSFSPFQSVKATCSADPTKNYSLKVNQDYKTNFYYETPDADFTITKPAASVYNFSAVFENGVKNEFQDDLTDKVLAIPVIEKTEYNATNKELGVTWTALSGANSYAIHILDGSTLIFVSPDPITEPTSFKVSSTVGWVTGVTPVIGKTYTVRLLAFLYEPSGNSYNIQSVSIADKPVVWGN